MRARFEDKEGRWWEMDVAGYKFRGPTDVVFKSGGEMTFDFRSGAPLPEGHVVVMFQGPVTRVESPSPEQQPVVQDRDEEPVIEGELDMVQRPEWLTPLLAEPRSEITITDPRLQATWTFAVQGTEGVRCWVTVRAEMQENELAFQADWPLAERIAGGLFEAAAAARDMTHPQTQEGPAK
jgi:hypothetical protein